MKRMLKKLLFALITLCISVFIAIIVVLVRIAPPVEPTHSLHSEYSQYYENIHNALLDRDMTFISEEDFDGFLSITRCFCEEKPYGAADYYLFAGHHFTKSTHSVRLMYRETEEEWAKTQNYVDEIAGE